MSDLFEQGHACVIGVGADLPCTVRDATELAKILRDPERCAYPESQIHLLTERQANREQILGALEELARSTNEKSTVLIYFSGHGYQLLKPIRTYYLLAYGYSTEDLSGTAISSQELLNALQKIPAKKLLVLLDCCHAGGLSDLSGFEITKAPMPPEATEFFSAGSGRIAIASSRPNQLSLCFKNQLCSVFTQALIEAFCGEGTENQSGFVRVGDVAMYLSKRVSQLTQDKQNPMLDFLGADNVVLAYYAAGNSQPKGVPSHLANPEFELEPGEFERQMIETTQIEASGDRAVVVQDASGATIVVGDNNVMGQGNTVRTVNQRGKYSTYIEHTDNLHIGDRGDED
ncbi:MAG: caspase family protein [Spirulina sp. SIO3F2]|nr:caspase family protein [Spirulina sp. SIO3F2]